MNIGSTRTKINIIFYIGFVALCLTTAYTAILMTVAFKILNIVKKK